MVIVRRPRSCQRLFQRVSFNQYIVRVKNVGKKKTDLGVPKTMAQLRSPIKTACSWANRNSEVLVWWLNK